MRNLRIIFLSLLTLLGITAIVGYIMYRNANTEIYDLDDAARKTASGSFVKLSDGYTHYELAGPDTGKVVVLVHGFSVPYYIWDSTTAYLTKAGFRVLRYDEYGRGYSDRPETEYTATFLRRQITELLNALKIQRVHGMAGLSFGGPVVADFVANSPAMVAKVIFVDPLYPDTGPADQPYPEFFVRYMMALHPEKMVSGQLTDLKYPERFPSWGDQYKVQMQYRGLRRALVSTRFHYASAETIRENFHTLDSLHKPVLLIWGKEDNTVPFRFADSLRKAVKTEYLPVDDAAHLPHMEKAQMVNERIIAFLKEE
jgi:pimeloyl-ACP methyl ester carboxylesterase